MTIKHAIMRFDLLHPNQLSYDQKLSFLSELDEMVYKEMIPIYKVGLEVAFKPYTTETNPSTELLVPFPFDDVYIKYLAIRNDITCCLHRYLYRADDP